MKNLKKTYLYLANIQKNRRGDLIKTYARLAEIALQDQDNEVYKEYFNKIQNMSSIFGI